jgi:hypothetical protein
VAPKPGKSAVPEQSPAAAAEKAIGNSNPANAQAAPPAAQAKSPTPAPLSD